MHRLLPEMPMLQPKWGGSTLPASVPRPKHPVGPRASTLGQKSPFCSPDTMKPCAVPSAVMLRGCQPPLKTPRAAQGSEGAEQAAMGPIVCSAWTLSSVSSRSISVSLLSQSLWPSPLPFCSSTLWPQDTRGFICSRLWSTLSTDLVTGCNVSYVLVCHISFSVSSLPGKV